MRVNGTLRRRRNEELRKSAALESNPAALKTPSPRTRKEGKRRKERGGIIESSLCSQMSCCNLISLQIRSLTRASPPVTVCMLCHILNIKGHYGVAAKLGLWGSTLEMLSLSLSLSVSFSLLRTA